MDKIIPNGTEVLIFSYYKGESQIFDDINFIKGKVIHSELSEDLSMHGSPWNVQIYTVLGEDGVKYFGPYGKGFIWGKFFRTKEDYIKYINSKIESNNEKITEIQQNNSKYLEIVESLNEIDKEKPKIKKYK